MRKLGLIGFILACTISAASAADYPDHPIHFIVPQAAVATVMVQASAKGIRPNLCMFPIPAMRRPSLAYFWQLGQ